MQKYRSFGQTQVTEKVPFSQHNFMANNSTANKFSL